VKYQIKNIINKLFFPLRKSLAFSRPIKTIQNESKINIFNDKNTTIEEDRIIKEYNLNYFKEHSKVLHYKENLYTIKLMENIFEKTHYNWNKNTLEILDIGSKNFSYSIALQHFFQNYKSNQNPKRTIYLDGIEIDPYRIMADLHSRYDYANYFTNLLPNTRYLTGNLLDLNNKKYDIITWFLPFLSKEPLLNWGLPENYLKPEILLKHALNILKTQGIIIISNQLETEKNIQLQIIQSLGFNYTETYSSYQNIFSPFQYERYITTITKD
jgi:hypothetical protein